MSTDLSDPGARIRHLSRLLSALCLRAKGGELRVSQATLDQLRAEEPSRALFEYFDVKTGQVVLCFRHKALATYFVDEPACQSTQTSSPHPAPRPQTSTSVDTLLSNAPPSRPGSTPQPTTAPGVHLPLTDAQLAKAERILQREKTARQFRRSAQNAASGATPPPSSNPLDEILSG